MPRKSRSLSRSSDNMDLTSRVASEKRSSCSGSTHPIHHRSRKRPSDGCIAQGSCNKQQGDQNSMHFLEKFLIENRNSSRRTESPPFRVGSPKNSSLVREGCFAVRQFRNDFCDIVEGKKRSGASYALAITIAADNNHLPLCVQQNLFRKKVIQTGIVSTSGKRRPVREVLGNEICDVVSGAILSPARAQGKDFQELGENHTLGVVSQPRRVNILDEWEEKVQHHAWSPWRNGYSFDDSVPANTPRQRMGLTKQTQDNTLMLEKRRLLGEATAKNGHIAPTRQRKDPYFLQ